MRQVAIGAFVLVAISFVLSIVLHHAALGWVERARRHMGNGDWGAAIQCLDRAHREDPFLVEA